MNSNMRKLLFISVTFILPFYSIAYTKWTSNGVVMCPNNLQQSQPNIVSDGVGGAIISWVDQRTGSYDIYAQRINASGVVQWSAGGVPICTATGDQTNAYIVSDGAGGAIIMWSDYRSGSNYDIYVQKVNATGVVQWATNGVAICTASGDQISGFIVSDGSGGAIISWRDYRSGSNYDIYAQRINSSGSVQWTANGVAICTASGDQKYPILVGDGTGGAIISWYDYRSGSNYDIYAQRINSSGSVQWTANGIAICTAANTQQYPGIVSDGSGGAIITWMDYRSGSNYDIYAQRVNSIGAAQWTANGVLVCAAINNYVPKTVSDGAGGAIITWTSSNYDIYAQRINGSGSIQWAANGVAVCTATGNQAVNAMVSDGAGGAFIAWGDDNRNGGLDFYAQKINSAGVVSWTADGVAVCTAAGEQSQPETIAIDDSGGAIFTWYDNRSGGAYQIYSQKTGNNPLINSISPNTANNHGILNVSNLAGNNFSGSETVMLRKSGQLDINATNMSILTSSKISCSFDLTGATEGLWAIAIVDTDGQQAILSNGLTINNGTTLPTDTYNIKVTNNLFNPVSGGQVNVQYTIPADSNVKITVYTSGGRLIRTLLSQLRTAGSYSDINWDGKDDSGNMVASGVYTVFVEAGSYKDKKRVVIVK